MRPLYRPLGWREALTWYIPPRRLLGIVCVLAALIVGGFLGGCRVMDNWRYTHQPLPMVTVELGMERLQAVCRSIAGTRYPIWHGCVWRDYVQGACYAYVDINPPAWVVEHERRHCEGWSHE